MAACQSSPFAYGIRSQELDRAEDALRRGDVGTTLSILEGRAQDSVRGQMILGRAYLALGDFGRARGAFRRAAELEPRDVEAWLAIAETAERERFFEHALDAYKKALAANVNDSDARRRLAYLLADLGRLSEAAAALRKALETDPADVDLRLRLGSVELRRGRFDEAEAAYTHVLERSPDPIAEAHLGRGIARSSQALAERLASGERVEAAEADLTTACELASDAADGPYNLGWHWEEVRKDPTRAEAWYREALRRNPEHVQATLRLATVLEARGERAEALELYRRAQAFRVSPFARPALADRVEALTKENTASAPSSGPESAPETLPASRPID